MREIENPRKDIFLLQPSSALDLWYYQALRTLLFPTDFFAQAFDTTIRALATIVWLWMSGCFFSALFQCKTDFWALWGTLAQYLDHCIKTTGLFESLAISDVI